jgi:hypothetical protein
MGKSTETERRLMVVSREWGMTVNESGISTEGMEVF